MKKRNLLSLLAVFGIVFSTTSCSNSEEKNADKVLRLYNWQDYIYTGDSEDPSADKAVLEQFEEYYEAKHPGVDLYIVYDTFETNETMLNQLKTGKSSYDLVCPSDYAIQKMIREGMLKEFTTQIDSYETYGSKYFKNVFETTYATNEDGEQKPLADYAIPYMWGTLGFMYNPDKVAEKDIQSWDVIWNSKYSNKITLKDSVRDTYAASVMHVYKEELNTAAAQYKQGTLTKKAYNNKVSEIMNRTDEETLSLVEKDLTKAKANILGFEVDSGKSDIVTGKIDINFCWSGDAAYALDLAEEENDVKLNYVVPKEGSNVWFDGWVMPKGADEELAIEFLDFICQPSIAILNMEEIGYTSGIAGTEVYDYIKDRFGVKTIADYTTEEYNALSTEEKAMVYADKNAISAAVSAGDVYEVDISYFFTNNPSGSYKVYTREINRQFSAQYPNYDTITRCAIMKDFGDSTEAVTEMWIRVKGDTVSVWVWVAIAVVVLGAIGIVIYSGNAKKARNARVKKNKKAYKK